MVILRRIYFGVYRRLWWLINRSRFKNLGSQTYIKSPLSIDNPKNISIGDNVYIGYKVWLASTPHTGLDTCELVIGAGCRIGNFNHIYSTQSIQIGENVLTADKVYISDNLHSFDNIYIPVLDQPIKQIKSVKIDTGTWIGENVCIIGAAIGKNCVVGANSVVTKDIPDYCVAVGSPARVIKRYCLETEIWKKTDKLGNFINE